MRDNKTNSLPRSGPVFPGSEVDDHGTTVATYFIGSYSYVVPSNFDVSYALHFPPFRGDDNRVHSVHQPLQLSNPGA